MSDIRARKFDDQERLVRHLIGTVRSSMNGSADDTAVIVDRDPTESVVLGVLEPRRTPMDPPPHPEIPDEPGVPIDILPPSELGVTVWVEPPPDATEIVFNVTTEFSVYLREYPTFDEQLTSTGGTKDTNPGLTDIDDDDLTVGDDDLAGDDSNQHPPTAPPPPPPPPPTPPPSARPRTIQLASKYRRHHVEAAFDVAVPIDGTLGTDNGAANAALMQVVDQAGFHRLAMRLIGRSPYGVPSSVLDAGQDAFERELDDRRTNQLPPLPAPEFIALATRDPRGGWRVSLTLANTADSESLAASPGQTIYDAGFSARLHNGRLNNFGYRLAEQDWRLQPEVFAHGRFCVGEVSDDHRTITTNTWPIYRDQVFESRPGLQPSFESLAADPDAELSKILARMREFADDWRTFADTEPALSDTSREQCRDRLAAFVEETDRLEAGIGLLQMDQRLRQAFVWTNEAFAALNTPGGLDPNGTGSPGQPSITSWRLFQVVFIVNGLSALAAREHGAPYTDDLGVADVLWFPTGGGKSEAFLGLTAVALFYDRLRGKTFGTTAFIRFPLRMLSVQQLDRVLRVVVACEKVRSEADSVRGDPFELGYFVGRGNTPNTLTNPKDDRWQDITAMSKWNEQRRRQSVVITTCPYCASTEVELTADSKRVRLDHRCLSCERRIPVVVSDDEVFRTLPAVVVATVDKFAAVAFQPHFSHFTHGPAFECPDHGYVTFAKGGLNHRRCIARTHCSRTPDQWQPVSAYDPAPALLIQDELHLLAQELGTLSAHYETLFAHLCRGGSELPSKVIAATATISDYENQVRHLYALKPRRFPSEGFRAGETFYASRLELPRRLYVGALPSRVDTAQFGQMAARTWRRELAALRAKPAAELIAELGLEHYREGDIADLLFRYELQLFYANRKNDAERTHEQMRRDGHRGPVFFDAALLTGDTPLTEISEAIRRVGAENLTSHPNAAERLGTISGTSLVSHGIDLARLNVMHVAGMPSTNAYYVQATARAGRTDVGAVFMAFSRSFARDRAAFHFFEPQHQFSNSLVEAVSLNRFAVNSPKKTTTGVMSAVIINLLARDPAINPIANNEVNNLMYREAFLNWFLSNQIALEARILDEVLDAYGGNANVLDPVVAGYFADEIERRVIKELNALRGGSQVTIQKSFLSRPPSSFRDIDEAVEFGAAGYWSGRDFTTLTQEHESARTAEGHIAVEQEEVD